MGTHSKPKVGYLPKVAAGAAPFALLFAGQATAWADSPPLVTPIDHQHSGSFDKDLRSGSNDVAAGTSAFVTGFVTASNDDTYSSRLGGQVVQALDRSAHHVETSNVARTTLPLNPAQGQVGPTSQQAHRLALADSRYAGIRLPGGVDAIGEFSNAPQLELARTTALTGDASGAAHAVAGLAGRAGLDHSDGYAVDLGDLAAFGTSSEQDGTGSFTGLLDLTRGSGGALTSTVNNGVDVAAHQTHAVGGHLGALSTDTSTSQSGKVGDRGSIRGRLDDGGELALDSAVEQNLGVDHVFHIDAGLATGASAAGGVAGAASTHSSHASQEGHAHVQLLDQAPVGGGLTLSAPPLQLQ